jgi:hypothetical protein
MSNGKMAALQAAWTGYGADPDEMPLEGYAVLLGTYAVLFGALLGAAARRKAADRITTLDVVLAGIATHKIGRIVTKDWVTSPLRAPFTEYKASTGGGEVREQARGHGLSKAVGDLLTCPWCIAPWVAGGLYAIHLASPRAARIAASVFASVAVSDFLQHGYGGVRRATDQSVQGAAERPKRQLARPSTNPRRQRRKAVDG